MKKTLLALALGVALTGCTQPAPDTSVSPEKVTSIVILKEAWEEYSGIEQMMLCDQWADDSNAVLDRFFSNGTDWLTRDEVRAFFDFECNVNV